MIYGRMHNANFDRRRRLAIEPLEDRRLLSLGSVVEYSPLIADVSVTLPTVALETAIRDRTESMYAAVLEQVSGAHEAGPLQASQDSPNLADLPHVNSGSARVEVDGDIQTYIHVDEVNDAMLAAIQGLGIDIDTSNAEMGVVQAWVSPSSVEELLDLPGVERLGMPDYAVPRTGAVTSDGDEILRADDVRAQFAAFGVDGSGIKVGVIGPGIDDWTTVSATGDLPGSITIDPLRTNTGNEGTAMLEIVHDLAPGAELYFSGPDTSLEMVDSIDWLVGEGVDVIIDDLGFFGEPYFEDGPVAQAAQSAVNADIVYVTAAGNQSQDHYQAGYVVGEVALGLGGNWHDFGGGDRDQEVIIPPLGTMLVRLEWSDPFGGSGNNYDLHLVNINGDSIFASENPQTGTQNPFEAFNVTNNSATQSSLVRLAILKSAGAAERELELFTIFGTQEEHSTRNDSIIGQQAVLDVISVGAIDADDPGNNAIEQFSSRGPSTIYTNFATQTSIDRDSLDGAGIDGVETQVGALGLWVDGAGNPIIEFFGTSAAAPHVAALAALVLDADDTLSPAAVSSILQTTAVDIEAPGYDSRSGFGRFDGLAAVYKAFTPDLAPDMTPGTDSGTLDDDDLTNDPTPTFTGTVPADSYVQLYVDGVPFGDEQLDSGNTTYSITSDPIGEGTHDVTIKVAENEFVDPANFSNESDPLAIEIDTTAPQINRVVAVNLTNAPGFRTYLMPTGTGEQIRTINLGGGIDAVNVRFTEDVDVDLDDVTLTDVSVFGQPITKDELNYIQSTFTASFEFNHLGSSLMRAQLEVGLNSDGASPITDLAGNRLDGEWVNPTKLTDTGTSTFSGGGTSGNGTEGGDFEFYITVLPGDVDLANWINNQNGYVTWANNFGLFPGTAQMTDGDYGGNAFVDAPDYTVWSNNWGANFTEWPGGAAAAAASSGPSATGAEAAFDAVVALYESDAALLDDETLELLAQESAKKQKPLWEQHAKNFFDWNGKELKENGLEGFLDELEEFLMPQS